MRGSPFWFLQSVASTETWRWQSYSPALKFTTRVERQNAICVRKES